MAGDKNGKVTNFPADDCIGAKDTDGDNSTTSVDGAKTESTVIRRGYCDIATL